VWFLADRRRIRRAHVSLLHKQEAWFASNRSDVATKIEAEWDAVARGEFDQATRMYRLIYAEEKTCLE